MPAPTDVIVNDTDLPLAEQLPTTGGSYTRDPDTGELTRAEEPTKVPERAPIDQ